MTLFSFAESDTPVGCDSGKVGMRGVSRGHGPHLSHLLFCYLACYSSEVGVGEGESLLTFLTKSHTEGFNALFKILKPVSAPCTYVEPESPKVLLVWDNRTHRYHKDCYKEKGLLHSCFKGVLRHAL